MTRRDLEALLCAAAGRLAQVRTDIFHLCGVLGHGLLGGFQHIVAVIRHSLADGAGLGHDFLRHIDRCRLLIHLVDVSGSEGRDPVEDFEQINHELANYGELAERPQIVVCNKSDLPDSEENVVRLKAHLAELGLDYPVFVVSAATHQGFDALLDKTGDMLEALPPIVHFEEEVSYDDSVTPGTFEVVPPHAAQVGRH